MDIIFNNNYIKNNNKCLKYSIIEIRITNLYILLESKSYIV